MERKERKDHARNKALVLIAISKGINAWKEIAQEIGKTQRATFDILKELERDEIIEGEREKSFNPHNTKKVRYRFKEQGVIGSILSSFKIWDLIWNVPEKREEFMRTEAKEDQVLKLIIAKSEIKGLSDKNAVHYTYLNGNAGKAVYGFSTLKRLAEAIEGVQQ